MMTLKQAQEKVDQWIRQFGVRYFNELTNMAILTEEVGEVARILARTYGEQSYRTDPTEETEPSKEPSDPAVILPSETLADELSDVLFVLICLANQTGIDLEAAFHKNLQKKTTRDFARHQQNDKLR